MNDTRQVLAVFVDFENLALGLRGRDDKFDIHRILTRLVEKGDIVVKRAYADWNRFASFTASLHEAAIELIEIPRRAMTGKNSADMRLCVDCMDLCYAKGHINTFVIVSGDSDFSPLVSKLKENGKQVIGLGMHDSTSDLLRDNCHEFIYYEDLKRESEASAVDLKETDEKDREVFGLLIESLETLRRENRDTLWSSLIKETMKRKRPSFNEAYYGYKSFSRLLEAAARRGLVELSREGSQRTLVVTRFGPDVGRAEPGAKTSDASSDAPPRRRKRVKRKRTETPAAPKDGEPT